MRKGSSKFNTSFISEAGTMPTNKDYFAFMELDDYACWVAADGIDSDEDIQSAELAAQSIFSDFSEKPTMSRRKLKKYIMNAHRLLGAESKSVRLKASMAVVVTDYTRMIWATAGNSRLYHFRKERFSFRSKDQSIAQMLAEAGKIQQNDVDNHPERNNLTNYIGKPKEFKPFVSRKYDLNDGDVIILATSGFWENISIGEMMQNMKDAKEADEFLDKLEDVFLSKQSRIINNYTAAAIFADKVFVETKKSKMSILKKVIAVIIPIAMLVGGLTIYRINLLNKIRNSKLNLYKHEDNGDEFVKSGDYDDALNEYNQAKSYEQYAKLKIEEQKLDKKCKITQMIINGDKNFQSKDYNKAMDSYKNAKKLADTEKDYDQKELLAKITKTQNYMNVVSLQNEADALEKKQDFAGAKAKYEAAAALAGQIGYDEAKQAAQSKAQEEDNKIADVDKQKDLLKAADYAKQGDAKFDAQKYDEAIKFYLMAKQIYNKYNDVQALTMDSKIQNAQQMMMPVVPPTTPTTPSNTNTTPTTPSTGSSTVKQ